MQVLHTTHRHREIVVPEHELQERAGRYYVEVRHNTILLYFEDHIEWAYGHRVEFRGVPSEVPGTVRLSIGVSPATCEAR
jgi:hypothetical protein